MRGSSAMVIRFLRSTSLFSLTCSVLGQSTPPVRATLLRTFAVFLQLSRCVRPCVTLEGNSPKPSRPRPGATSTVLPAPTERQLSIQDLENARSSFGCSNHDSPHCTCEDLPQQSSRASQLFLGPPRLATRVGRARKRERIGRGGRKRAKRRGGGGRRCPRCPALRALRHRSAPFWRKKAEAKKPLRTRLAEPRRPWATRSNLFLSALLSPRLFFPRKGPALYKVVGERHREKIGKLSPRVRSHGDSGSPRNNYPCNQSREGGVQKAGARVERD